MSRSSGFVTADVNVGILDDPKVRRLWRLCGRDEGTAARAMLLYLATVLASWQAGGRVAVDEAAAVWLTPDPELVSLLQGARLLDDAGLVPEASWEGWFGIARDRREERRQAGSRGGKISTSARAQLKQSSSTAQPVPILSVPTDTSRAGRRAQGAPAREGSLKAVLKAMGAEPDIAKEDR